MTNHIFLGGSLPPPTVIPRNLNQECSMDTEKTDVKLEMLTPTICNAFLANGKLYNQKAAKRMVRLDFAFEVGTLEGTTVGRPGDFLAEDGNGGFCAISADIKEQTYRPARQRTRKPAKQE